MIWRRDNRLAASSIAASDAVGFLVGLESNELGSSDFFGIRVLSGHPFWNYTKRTIYRLNRSFNIIKSLR